MLSSAYRVPVEETSCVNTPCGIRLSYFLDHPARHRHHRRSLGALEVQGVVRTRVEMGEHPANTLRTAEGMRHTRMDWPSVTHLRLPPYGMGENCKMEWAYIRGKR